MNLNNTIRNRFDFTSSILFIQHTGVNLRNANLEGSQMAKVNLRVATLKHGNMKNCDLRGAVLAGADLEVEQPNNPIFGTSTNLRYIK